jgi:subtilisin-like proprotein convertase family protein
MKSKIHNPSFCEQAKQHQKNNLKILSLFLGMAIISSCSKNDDKPSDATTAIRPESYQESGLILPITDAITANSVTLPKETYKEITFNESDNPKVIDYKKIRLDLNVKHSFQQDLSFTLIAPDGTPSLFVYRMGGNADYIETNKLRFSGQFTTSMPDTNIDMPAGDYKESQPAGGAFGGNNLAPIFAGFQGKSVNGIWKLKITDSSEGDIGTLERVRLTFESGSIK